MAYRYRQIDVRKGWVLWQARPVMVDEPERDRTFVGMNTVPHRNGECWWRGLTREQAIRRARRYARRQNRRLGREEAIERQSL